MGQKTSVVPFREVPDDGGGGPLLLEIPLKPEALAAYRVGLPAALEQSGVPSELWYDLVDRLGQIFDRNGCCCLLDLACCCCGGLCHFLRWQKHAYAHAVDVLRDAEPQFRPYGVDFAVVTRKRGDEVLVVRVREGLDVYRDPPPLTTPAPQYSLHPEPPMLPPPSVGIDNGERDDHFKD